jgi:hypothetical protein
MGPKLISLSWGDRILVIGAILLVIVLVRVILYMTSRKKPVVDIPLGTPRNYRFSGGAVCPKCHRPFRLEFLAIKIGFGVKFARCEFCGKWSVVRRLSPDELRAAEAAELSEGQPAQAVHARTDNEKLENLLDESRFTDKQ